MNSHALLLALVLSVPAPRTQLPYTAYPMDALPQSLGHWTPLGALSTGNADESRSQHLIPAPYLPCGGTLIAAIEFAPHMTGTVPYERLQIAMGLTNATALGTDFTANLPVPTVVYAATNVRIDWGSPDRWCAIPLQNLFVHDGQSSLVIDIQKVVDRANNPTVPHITHQMNSLPQRRDLPRPVFKDGTYQSGAATATSGLPYIGPPMLMRLQWIGGPTLTIDGTRTTGNWYRLGADVGLHVHGPAGAVFVQLFDGRLASQPLSAAPVVGLYWLPLRFVMLGAGVVGPGNQGDLVFRLPAQTDLVDGHLYFQSLLIDSSLVWTNVVDAVVSS